MTQQLYVWDFPTRLFHWLLVAAICAQYLTAEILDDAVQWHFYGGYFILGLVIFRVLWGIWGAYYARFNQFVHTPQATWHYAKSLSGMKSLSGTRPSEHIYVPSIGHNPLGAYSIIFILSILLTQSISGLFITDEIFHDGPYYSAVSESTRDVMNWLHHQGFNAILLFLALHLSAILIYKIFKKQNLVASMLHGKKQQDDTASWPPTKNHWLRFTLLASISAVAVYLIVVVFAPELADDFDY
jgi:cytochrome b